MSAPVTQDRRPLSEKEKQTLRLILRGHDAKSIARTLDLSVHTINERLRDARRKLAVSSSREAARLLYESESDTPQNRGDKRIGEAAAPLDAEQEPAPIPGARQATRPAWIPIGVALMTLLTALFALSALPQTTAVPTPVPPAAAVAADPVVVAAARRWLVLLDQSRWDDSYRATGTAFRRLNTRGRWVLASQRVRAPLGALVSRELISQEDVPAPPSGYQVVKFRSRFAAKANAVETVTLEWEAGTWRIVGVTVG